MSITFPSSATVTALDTALDIIPNGRASDE
jgi:hypothetical protein